LIIESPVERQGFFIFTAESAKEHEDSFDFWVLSNESPVEGPALPAPAIRWPGECLPAFFLAGRSQGSGQIEASQLIVLTVYFHCRLLAFLRF
jgi:hypothetical protein